MKRKISILRLGHRVFRDQRITSHCALVSRALGARDFYYTGQKDEGFEKSIKSVVSNWGGSFKVTYVPKHQAFLKGWRGKIAHLTVYGIPYEKAVPEMRKSRGPLLLVVGGEKVPPEIYQRADWNISVTGQPHSEVAGLALTLDRLFKGKYPKSFSGAKLKVVPQKKGKKILKP